MLCKIYVFVNKKGQFGNPLGIVIDDQQKLNKIERQKIAAKLNYSETVFVDDLNSPLVSIFNPTDDMDFSGYAVLGSAYFLKHILGKKFASIRCGTQQVTVTEDNQLIWITAPLAIMPPWNFKQLKTAKEIEQLTKEEFSNQKHLVVWAWIDEKKNLIRARTFAPDWGIPEDEANGSGAMRLATKLNQSLKIIHGLGSEIFAAPVDKNSAKLGGRITLSPMV